MRSSSVSAHSPRFLIGIDLGTTHTVAAFTDLRAGAEARIELFPIEQSVRPGEVAARSLLPSVRYQASLDELTAADALLPWGSPEPAEDYRPILGELARWLGARSRGRSIFSAKSWLSHPGADRTAAILPWGAPETVPKVSPVVASAGYLRHVRAAWNHHYPDALLEEQEVVVTVPASFDEAARALTLEAARAAGLGSLRLLEEPQAVCYDWLWEHRETLARELEGVRLLLVMDVGGGTTDLTLIRVEPGAEGPKLSRVAVGNHLMLGGDNLDLALAHLAEARMVGDGARLGAAELYQLVEQCRLAKELLLGEAPPEAATVTLLGGGSRLIGAARSAELRRDEVHDIVLSGFFPLVGLTAQPDRKRSGVVEFGLPYVADPAVTRHLAAFLAQHRQAAAEALGSTTTDPLPDAVLLNGGVFWSPVIARRVVQQLTAWRGSEPKVLVNVRPDLAVAHGAVAYGKARRGQAIQRIGGGSARSYFLVVETPDRTAARGVCILPRGTEEGREVVLADRTFLLKLGLPVRFHLMVSADDFRPEPGAVVELDEEGFQPLPPLAVALEKESGRGELSVRLAATLTDIGTLDLHCFGVDDPARRWNIEFQLRHAPPAGKEGPVQPHLRLDEALDLIRQVFGKRTRTADPKAIKGLRSELERQLGGRDGWDMALLRDLFGALLDGLPHRRRSPDHERLWCSLAGFCLRPGFGFPLDEWRVEQLFVIYEHGLQFVNEVRNWAEWWTLWRRVAGGLPAEAQQRVFQDVAEYINPETARRGNLPALVRKRSYEDMVRLAAVLERLPVTAKVDLGNWLLQRLGRPGEPPESWWALGRIGTRVPFHGSVHTVVPVAVATEWLEAALRRDFRKEPQPGFAAALLARRSGDRERDVDDPLRARVLERLRAGRAPESWLTMVAEVTELSESDARRVFGEALPPGLQLIA